MSETAALAGPGDGATGAGPLASPVFRRLLASTVLSTSGDWLDFVAVLVLVNTVWHRGATGLAVIAAALGAPLLLAPVVGAWADARPARRVMVTSDVARALLTLGAALSPNLLILAPLLFLRSGIGAAFAGSEQRALIAAVPQRNLLRANALQQSAVQGLKILAPVLGSVLTVAAGPRISIGINAASYALSGLLLLGLPRLVAQEHPEGRFVEQVRAGLAVVFGDRALRLLLISLCATLFMTFTFDSMVPLAITRLGLPNEWIGFLVGAVGLGALAGALALSRLRSMRRPLFWVALGQAGVAVTMAGLAVGLLHPFAHGGPLWLLVIFLTGVGTALVLVPIPLVVQTSSPPQFIARTWAFIGVLPASLQVLAPVLSAVLLRWIGLGVLFLAAAAGLSIVAAATLVLQRRLPPVPDLDAAADEAEEAAVPGPARDGPPTQGGPAAGQMPALVPIAVSTGEEVNHMGDLERFEELGLDVESLSAEEQAVLSDLTDEEIAVLTSIRARLDHVSGDVEAHTDATGGILF